MQLAPDVKCYIVGGAVRDDLMGLDSKDVDFAVEAPSFAAMRDALVGAGFKVFVENEEFLTLRASVPKDHPLRERTRDADFVMCRADGPTADGRRPEFVTPGSLLDDLARRDFTVNAIARDPETGELVDPFGGVADIKGGVLRFVGNPADRISEDGLRVLRGFRFSITKGMGFDPETERALKSPLAGEMLGAVSIERIREELVKMFRADQLGTMGLLVDLPQGHKDAIFRDGLRVEPTLKA